MFVCRWRTSVMNWMCDHCVTRSCRMLACFSMLTEDRCSSFRGTGVHMMTTLEVPATTWGQVTQRHQTLWVLDSTILQWGIQGLERILCHRHTLGTRRGPGTWSPSCSMCVPVRRCRRWRRRRRSKFPGGWGLLATLQRAGSLSIYLMHTRSVPENSIPKMTWGGCFATQLPLHLLRGPQTLSFLLSFNCTGWYCALYAV